MIIEPTRFWAIMSDLGIMDDIMEMILNSFDQTRRLANMGAAQRDVGMLRTYCFCKYGRLWII